SIFVVDIDGDTDLDLLTTSYFTNTAALYKNIGQGNFGVRQIISNNIEGILSVIADDMDGDGDMDVLCAGYEDNTISWFKNLDGTGNFGLQQIITTNNDYATSVNSFDIDDDGDKDVLSTSLLDSKLAWYENLDGQGTFGEQTVISTIVAGPVFTSCIDIDGDEDLDILVAGFYDDKLIWH